jgi:hypothetical protein
MRPQALEQWQILVRLEENEQVPVLRASASLLRVAALLWRGGGEADGIAASAHSKAACAMLKGAMGRMPSKEDLLSLADGLHVNLFLMHPAPVLALISSPRIIIIIRCKA